MKTRLLAALGAALGLALASAAHAQEPLYLKGELGGAFGGEYDGAGSADLEDGWRYGAALGAGLTPNMRLEGEVFRADADIEGSGAESNATA